MADRLAEVSQSHHLTAHRGSGRKALHSGNQAAPATRRQNHLSGGNCFAGGGTHPTANPVVFQQAGNFGIWKGLHVGVLDRRQHRGSQGANVDGRLIG